MVWLTRGDKPTMPAMPLLMLTDSADANSGLGRIARDLATLLCRSPRFRVGLLGRGGNGSRKLPFSQYVIQELGGQWGEGSLQRVWEDFAGDEEGVIFTIWDATRLLWLAQSRYIQAADPPLAAMLQRPTIHKWGYFPIDGEGPNGKLTGVAQEALLGYDRLLAYTKWGQAVVERTLGQEQASQRRLDWLPHGINASTFTPRDKKATRQALRWRAEEYVIGHVGTNQTRKDWGLFFATAAALRSQVKRLRVWCHVDVMERHWSIPALINDYGLGDCVTVTHFLTDVELSHWYSALDVLLHPSPEGFGYPIFEALACGTPVIVGGYGGGADVFRQCGHGEWLVEPQGYRLETPHNVLRPVYEPADWVSRIHMLRNVTLRCDTIRSDTMRDSIAHLSWANLWPSWLKWFEEGLPS